MLECAERRNITLLDVAECCSQVAKEVGPASLSDERQLSADVCLLARDDDEDGEASSAGNDSGFSASDATEAASAAKRRVSPDRNRRTSISYVYV